MTRSTFDLDNKIALVTGASSGIGEAVAKLLAEYGAHVIVSSRKVEKCQLVVDQIVELGGSAEAIACHVGDMEDIDAIFSHIKRTHGRLDILVNNAATNPYFGSVVDTDLSSFQKAVDVNLRGYFFMSAQACKLMREGEGGAIINNASVNALHPGIDQGIYSITKAGIVNMTKSFAQECAKWHIRVNAVLPGFTKTHFSNALFNDETAYSQIMAGIPMERHASPDEIAGSILYLASTAASYTTGESIVVDGGMCI